MQNHMGPKYRADIISFELFCAQAQQRRKTWERTDDMMQAFTLPPLPYAYNALEPYLNSAVLGPHHNELFAGYVERLNGLIEAHPKLGQWSLEQMTRDWMRLPDPIRVDVRNNAGGVYNHALYFQSLTPAGGGGPNDILISAIERDFGSLPDFWRAFRYLAMKQFGSGNIFLVADRRRRLQLHILNWQNTPFPLMPLAVVDLWEHAWWPQYGSHKDAYVDAVIPLLNWENIAARYNALLNTSPRYPLENNVF